ncbi:Sensor histidine kinase LiaS [Pontiella desulfatans]|uniref:Sensor histidine kinase LiaS n=2 Tax=Pontiella desulfatans TaxID=2750659 RepID=A0A6C2U9K4_PONDE|nr:Sensor histidine kinase LiaS [Pontiella desulfatans]
MEIRIPISIPPIVCRVQHVALVTVFGGVFLQGHIASAEPVDPCYPSELKGAKEGAASQSRFLPNRIRQLEDEEWQLLDRISRLPQHDPKPLPDHLGYHSIPREPDDPEGLSTHISAQFEYDPGLGAIALAPAFVPGEAGGYSFPRRFKIEVIDRGARWIGDKAGAYYIPSPPYEWTEVVNWMDEDFPDPGPYPVFFEIGNPRVHQLRMTLMDKEASTYNALGEMYLFRQPENSDRLGDNMMAWTTVQLTASNALSKPPLWDATYLADGLVGLGMPLSEELSDVGDFMIAWGEEEPQEEAVQIMLDLGEAQQIGRVQLWPAEAPMGMAIPHFGFPGKVRVELSDDPEFNNVILVEESTLHEHLNKDNLLNIITQGKKVRYLRLTLNDFPSYKGKTIMGLGEVRVSEFDDVWSINCAVTATGMPEGSIAQLPRLVDGFSRRRQILREAEWIKGLAQRRPLDRRLTEVRKELDLARVAWNRFKLRASIWGGGLLCLALLAAMGLQRLQRRHVLKRLKLRITRDLHDEVGSSLGGITLAARRMEDAGATQKDLTELSLMAREASAALKDVVWVLDQSRIRLPELLKKLAERAERVLVGMELVVSMPDTCPDREVPLPFKRHLLMFFKEAIHNCSRHSEATEVELAIFVRDDMLTVRIHDNGVGFDPDAIRDGWGVNSMGKRAQELGGRMELISEPGKGTTIQLSVPLSALLHKTDHTYKTSN